MSKPESVSDQPPPSAESAGTSQRPSPTTETEVAFLKKRVQQFESAGNILEKQIAHLQSQLSTLKPTTKLPSSIKLPTVSKYSGDKREDLLAWLFQINEHLTLAQLEDDNTRILFAGTALTGNALTWYRSMKMAGEVTTWEEFKASLQAHFYPIDPVKQARDQLHPLVQTTSVREYTATFRHLCAIINNISEDEKLDRYVRGLKTRTRTQVELKEPHTFDDACRLAEIIDISNDRIFSSIYHKHPYSKPRRDGPAPMDLSAVNDRRDKPRNDAKAEPKFKKLTQEEKDRRRREGLCVYCGSNQHQLDGCPLRKPQGKGPQRLNRGA